QARVRLPRRPGVAGLRGVLRLRSQPHVRPLWPRHPSPPGAELTDRRPAMALVTALRRLDTHDALESLRALRRRQPVTYWAFYSNVGFVTADGVFRHPKFDHILSGCTSLRVLDLARALVARGVITGVEVCDIPVTQARRAREMALIGSSVKVAP